ncbi:MAG: ABC transporter ATP-binding protein [Rhodospirillales bacterium]
MLEISGLQSGYAGALAIDGLSFRLGSSDSLAMLGRNGAGKSTTLKTIMGLIRPWSGTVTYAGTDITGWSSDRIARAGIGYVPEDRRVFPSLSVSENLETGAKPGSDGTVRWNADKVFQLFPEIARRRNAAAGTLSGGERQMLAIGRALMGNPGLLLLDEPSEGLAPVVVNRLGLALGALGDDGIAILIAEQNRRLAARVAGDVIILETGRIGYRGTFAELAADPAISERYLGL